MRPPENDTRIAALVLGNYPAPLRGRVEALGTAGGFSGASVWRVYSEAGELCLRVGSPDECVHGVEERHEWMRSARSGGLPFVPAVFEASSGRTVVETAVRCWELMEWMPGRADYRDGPSPERLRAACQALARLHEAWDQSCVSGPCPAIQRRLAAAAGLSATPVAHAPGSDLIARWLPRVPALLRDFPAECRLQPCLRDVWHDHLLFTGDELTGLVDYANAGLDSVAVDLARMLGSLVGDDEAGWQRGLAAYREVRPFSAEKERLARALDRAGVLVALANWNRWVSTGARKLDDPQAARRVVELVDRVSRW